jgi:hypothetical protein
MTSAQQPAAAHRFVAEANHYQIPMFFEGSVKGTGVDASVSLVHSVTVQLSNQHCRKSFIKS